MARPKVSILLSTYNGAAYLACQLDSLLAQDYPDFEVLVRDDGSTDETAAIVRRYAAASRPGRRVRFLNDPLASPPERLRNLRHNLSFWTLLREAGDADYYAFCDQDDFWEPCKVSRGVAALEAHDASKPLLYSSSFDYYDERLVRTGSPAEPRLPIRFKDVVFYAPAFGFTILLNRRLRETALSASDLSGLPHDCWCEMIAALLGEFVYDSAKTARYRRHSQTVTYVGPSRFRLVVRWLRHDLFGPVVPGYRRTLTRLCEEYGSQDGISPEDRRLLDLFRTRRVTPAVYLRRLFFPRRLRPTLGGELALRICFLLSR